MKKIFTFAFIAISVISKGQYDQRSKDSMILFAPTAIGKPDGEPVSQMINKDGGRLISSDKKVELIFPPGALPSETRISIQPATNLAPTGVGKAYSFEPSGIQFQQPVQLIFHYSDKDMDGDSPQLMSISTQNEKGSWFRLLNMKLDTLAKTITGTTRHFSFFAATWSFVFKPRATRVKVNKDVEVQLYIIPCDPADEADRNQAEVAAFDYQYQNQFWSVNGVPFGDATVGKIIKSPIREITSVVYKAPAKVPDMNPVEIVVLIRGVEMFGTFQNVTKKCKVLVYDDLYEVKMKSTLTSGPGEGRWRGSTIAYDRGSFIVSLDKKVPAITNIINDLEIMSDNCQNILLNPTTCTGLLHVAGAKEIKVTPANPPGQPYRIVEIMFVPFPIEFSRFSFKCPTPRGKGFSIGVDPPMKIGRALPFDIKFLAKDGEQIILESDTEDGYLKIWVRKINDD